MACVYKYKDKTFKTKEDLSIFLASPEGMKLQNEETSTLNVDVDEVRSKNIAGKRVSKGLATTYETVDGVKIGTVSDVDLSIEYVKEKRPKIFIKNANILLGYPIVRGGLKRRTVKTVEDAQKVYDEFLDRATENLGFLIDNFEPRLAEISTLWYDGANKIIHELSDKYNYTPEQVAAVMSALSPQKDWYQNVRLTELTLMAYADNAVMTSEMVDKQLDISNNGITSYNNQLLRANRKLKKSRSNKNKAEVSRLKNNLVKAKKKAPLLQEYLKANIGVKMSEAPIELQPYLVRLHSEVNITKDYNIVTPDGRTLGLNKNEDGANSKISWSTYKEIGKAVSVINDGSHANISVALGQMHKIRNFYNNMIDPMSEEGDLTMDTHAVGAVHFLPVSKDSNEVKSNFGTYKSGNSTAFGIKGLYYAYAEAYRRVAEEREMLPRQAQGITWEAIRGLYTKKFKSVKGNNSNIRSIWERYEKGEISAEQARTESVESAGGITRPSWAQESVYDESKESTGESAVGGRIGGVDGNILGSNKGRGGVRGLTKDSDIRFQQGFVGGGRANFYNYKPFTFPPNTNSLNKEEHETLMNDIRRSKGIGLIDYLEFVETMRNEPIYDSIFKKLLGNNSRKIEFWMSQSEILKYEDSNVKDLLKMEKTLAFFEEYKNDFPNWFSENKKFYDDIKKFLSGGSIIFQQGVATEVQTPQEIVDAVLVKLKETGLASEAYSMTSSQIEEKLVSLGVTVNIAKQVIAWHGTPNPLKNILENSTETNEAPVTKVFLAMQTAEVSVTPNGFIHNGEVYLNTDSPNILNTQVHEFGHLFNSWAKANRPDIYNKGIELIKSEDGKAYIDFVKESQPNLKGEKLYEEALTQAIGDQGQRFVETNARNSFTEWLSELWESLKYTMGITEVSAESLQYMTLNDFAKAVSVDLMKGGTVKSGFLARDQRRVGFSYNTEKLARERFNFSELKKIGEGSDRVTFDMGDGKVLKVSKTARGLRQNYSEGEPLDFVSDVYETGLNYVVAQKAEPIRMSKEFKEGLTKDQLKEAKSVRKDLRTMLDKFFEFSQSDFNNRTQDIQDVLAEYGMDEMLSWEVLWNDFTAEGNWGILDGKPIHVDGGTFAGVGMIDDYRGKEDLSDEDFRDIYYRSRETKKLLDDTDKFTRFQIDVKESIENTSSIFDSQLELLDLYSSKEETQIKKDMDCG